MHVAVPDRHTCIDLMNAARYFLPHLLALSTSSPFWMGRDTGLKSYRTTIFRRFPRTGIPDHFGSWGEYESYVNTLDPRILIAARQDATVPLEVLPWAPGWARGIGDMTCQTGVA